MLEGYYSELDMLPLDKWRAAKMGDLTALRIPTADSTKHSAEADSKAWVAVSNDFLKKVGFSEEYNEWLELIKQRAELCIQYLESRERFIINQINEINAKIDKFVAESKSDGKDDIFANLDLLSRARGYQIRITDLTALQYFTMIKDYG
jgi:hypothetical protein